MVPVPHPIVHVNASLNGLATLLLMGGYWAIRTGRRALHQKLMGSAFACSAAFLACYLYYHYQVGGGVRYPGTGWLRALYLGILLPHTILAAGVLPLILRTLFLARKERFAEHRRLARWTWPVWIFVSLSGVAVYLMLYQLPHGA